MEKAKIAENYFKEGYNCSQSVVAAFHEEMGLTLETATKIASGFGGGIGGAREVCGAVSGMVMVFSMLYGYSEAKAREEKKALYSKVLNAINTFKEQNSSYICKELLGLAKIENISAVPQERTKEYYKKRPCSLLVYDAAKIVEDFIKSEELQDNGS